MSRAFVKEDAPDNTPLPDLPVSPYPNYVTPQGLAALQSRLHAIQTRLATLRARPDRLDRLPEAAAERDIRYLESRLRSAIPVDPRGHPLTAVAFGLATTVIDHHGHATTYVIVGEDEVDPALGRIAPHAPLARALIGGHVGDTITLARPSGPLTLEITAIAHADPPA